MVPNLSKFTSIVGASGLTFVGFVMPNCMWLALLDPAASRGERVRAYGVSGLIVLLGLVAMVVGTTEAVKQAVN